MPTAARRRPSPAREVSGTDLDGEPRVVGVARPGRRTLLLFLAPHCDACVPFWTAAADAPSLGLDRGDEVTSIVRELGARDSGVLRACTEGCPGARARVVVSSAAWREYGVHGPPFFVLSDGVRVATEGVAWSVEQVAADVRRALGGAAEGDGTLSP